MPGPYNILHVGYRSEAWLALSSAQRQLLYISPKEKYNWNYVARFLRFPCRFMFLFMDLSVSHKMRSD